MNLFLLLACNGTKTDTADTMNPADTGVADTAETYPENPAPFTISTSGVMSQNLIFDEPSCSSPTGSTNMRMFWRNKNDAHVFVLVTEILGDFDGVGTYTSPEFRANIKLQEEAGGSGLYFASTDASNTVIEYELYEDQFAFGSAQIDSLEGSDGSISITPSSFPLWCDMIER